MSRFTRTTAAISLVGALSLGLSACGSDDTPAASAAPNASSSAPTTSSSPSESMGGMTGTDKQFGAGCAAVPTTGSGSFAGMAKDPVATAASNNPALSTLVTAVKAAGLVDTLNSADGITVFAPTNDAFKALPPATLKAALADPKGLLTKVLTYHVVSGKLSPEQVAGTHKTLEGNTLTVAGSGEKFTVDKANVVCGNVQTANATVYLIDGVLMPTM